MQLLHHRRSIRLPEYDYSQPGAYFVTLCVQNRECLLGKINKGDIILNDAGTMIENWFGRLTEKFIHIRRDEYIVMPNHLHAIIFIVGADQCVCPETMGGHAGLSGGHTGPWGGHTGPPLPDKRQPSGLPTIIQWLKTMTTNEYLRNIRINHWPTLNGRLWQRNYFEHVIRDEKSLCGIRQYIRDNPSRWEYDRENPLSRLSE